MDTLQSDRSRNLFQRAQQRIPGGVNSPVRAFNAVGGRPRFIASAQGCLLTDADGNQFVDYVGSWGPMILGHAHPEVVEELRLASARGTSFGTPTELEVELAEKICQLVPSIEKVRLVNSGTEATMSAVRLARAYTGRSLLIKFDGCYHGHGDSFLVRAGSGVATLGLPNSPGVPTGFTEQTISLPYNDLEAVSAAFETHADSIAALILEPVTGNMGVIVPHPGYLEGILRMAEQAGAIVIFDEVMTGFRLAAGGAQEMFSLDAPLTCLGKIVGGGLPIGAFGGRSEIMEWLAPEGPVYQAGTLSGNPLAVTAGLKTLEVLEREQPYAELKRQTGHLRDGLAEAAAASGINIQVARCGSMFTLFFSTDPVTDFASAQRSDTEQFARFFKRMMEEKIYLAPSQFEACFLSTCHTSEVLEQTLEAASRVFSQLPGG